MLSNALWLHAGQLPSVPPAVLDWLFDKGLLARCLTAPINGVFRVGPLLESQQTLCDDECQGLDVPPGSNGRVREVYLHGHGRPWMFARSVTAHGVLEDSGFDLALLDTRSLGELLFSDSALERGPIEVYRHPAASPPVEVRVEGLWGRHSWFSRGAFGVLVAEVFLLGLWDQAGITDI